MEHIHISVQTLIECHLSEWQELKDQLEADKEDSTASIAYCETEIERLLIQAKRLAANGNAD
ncbi:hypothetical protein GO755_29540 [Spirosoma sp. HMF4905]|uniref:Uncharacterized protein n=1 Tax=Spirosoma arboris TaxID=2682092 RepID=A0A7K1SK71_9BACT|nr:hypothetical protein [Spirosoma arboris]MVM34211.1 hypothetical protein [Spirosoma arboris]